MRVVRSTVSYFLLLASAIFVGGCAADGGSPPVLPNFNMEGGEEGEDTTEEQPADVADLFDVEEDSFTKPDTSTDTTVEDDTGEGGEEDSGNEGGEEDTITDTSGEGGDVVEDTCDMADDPDQWCADNLNLTGCDTAYCTDGECLVETITAPDCCVTSADCDDGNEITFDQCLGTIEGCSNQVDPTLCEDNVTFLQSTFDDGTLQGWTVQDEDGDQVVGWQLDTSRTHQGPFSFYFGHQDCETYYTGEMTADCQLPIPDGQAVGQEQESNPQVGSLLSPEFNIPSNSAVFLSFQVFADFELVLDPTLEDCAPGDQGFDGSCWSPSTEADFFDNMSVWISYYDDIAQESVMQELWNVVDLVPPFPSSNKGTNGEFVQVGVDLSPFAGKAARIVFEAHTDEYNNFNYRGAYVDSISVRTGCESVLCQQESDCQSPNTCKSFACTPLVNSDGGFCFGDPKKENCNACPGGTHPECNDGNDCTSDLCDSDNTCLYSAVAEEACCDGGETNGPYDFESGLPSGWSTSGGKGAIGWSVVDSDGGDKDLYFGNPVTGNYDGEGAVSGSVTTGFFSLPLAGYSLLTTMELKLATEYEMAPYAPGAPKLDQLQIHVLTNQDGFEVETLVFDSLTELAGATGVQQGEGTAVFENIGFDVSPWQGKAIRLKFSFDTIDAVSNDYGGVYIDNLAFVEICEEPSCTKDADCDDGFGCTTDSCVQGFCVSSKSDPLCCESDFECNDGNPCTNDNCVESIGCVNEPVADPNCCYEATTVISDFEGSDFGWTFDSISANVFWSFQTGIAAKEGNGFLYFGDPDIGTYQAFEGTLSSGTAVSPPVTIAPNGGTALSFDLFMETEWDNFPVPCDENCQALLQVNDVLTVRVRDQFFVETTVWNSAYINNSTAGEYVPVDLNLSAWAGQEVQVILEFKTTDPIFNDYAGVRIDNLGTYVVCSDTLECFSDLDCADEDGDECTTPTCTNNTCYEEEILQLPNCCFETPVMNTNFDSGTKEGFSFVGLTCGEDTFTEECFQNDNADVRWQLSTLQSYSPNHSLWFGNAATETYEDPGYAVAGWATSTEVSLFPGLSASLDLWAYLDVEAFSASLPTDRFEVIVVPEYGSSVVVWDKGELIPDDMGSWVNITADLSEFAGQVISIRVEFDSHDSQLNSSGGVFVDDIQVIQGCNEL